MAPRYERFEAAKAAAEKKIQGWAAVQSRAAAKKLAARAAGNERLAEQYFKGEVAASCRRYRHETAIDKMERMEREHAEELAWEARKAARKR